jgi:phospholipid/cholesterol/gamma-HCH transport system permease protein
LRFLELLGSIIVNLLTRLQSDLEVAGRIFRMFYRTVFWLFRPPFRYGEVIRQLDFVGTQSIWLIATTGLFTGMVLALQTQIGLGKYGADALVGAGVALSLSRELGPVLSALMVIGRAGSAMTTEIGTMRNTQQIDALATMAVEPIHYLVVPRVVAATLMLPLLAICFEFAGMVGAYFSYVVQLGKDGGIFIGSVRDYLGIDDIAHGLVKAAVFGLILSTVSCTKGFHAGGGARGVGLATTRGVVISSLLVLASDYMITAILY